MSASLSVQRTDPSTLTLDARAYRALAPRVVEVKPSASGWPSAASAAEMPSVSTCETQAPKPYRSDATPAASRPRRVPNEPASSSAASPSISRVVKAITPPMASDPHSDDCGPDRTSIRSMSPSSKPEKSKAPLISAGSLTGTPSTRTSVLPGAAPRIRTWATPPKAPERTTDRPGTSDRMSAATTAPR